MAASTDLAVQLKLQDEAAQILHAERQRLGALNIDRVETEAVIADGQLQGVEDFMVAANGVMARTLYDKLAKAQSHRSPPAKSAH